MKRFIMIWQILVPALAFCHDQSTPIATQTEQGVQLEVPGTVTEVDGIFGEDIYEDPSYDMNAR